MGGGSPGLLEFSLFHDINLTLETCGTSINFSDINIDILSTVGSTRRIFPGSRQPQSPQLWSIDFLDPLSNTNFDNEMLLQSNT